MDDGLRIDAEEAVISALLVDQKCIEKVYGMLSPEMFTNAVYGRIYLEYCRAFDRSKDITVAEVKQALEADGYKEYEIEDSLRSALTNTLTSAEVVGSARAVSSKYKASCADAILSRTELSAGKIDEQIDRLLLDLEKLRSGDSTTTSTVSEITEKCMGNYFIETDKPKVELGFDAIDDMVGGFEGGDLILVGARPAVGKSALVTQWSEIFASKGLKVGFYNLEMTEKQVYERFLAAKSGIEITRIRRATRFLNDEEERFRRANEELLKQDRIYISTGAKKVSDIRSEVKHMNYDVLIVDYLQLLVADGTYSGNRAAEVGEISRQLKAMAIDYRIPVIALSQLNRASEGRQNREPNMGELREAGNLEQDASVIILLWNKNEDDHSQKGCKVEKSRQGKTGRCDLVFDGSHMTFKMEKDVTPFDGR